MIIVSGIITSNRALCQDGQTDMELVAILYIKQGKKIFDETNCIGCHTIHPSEEATAPPLWGVADRMGSLKNLENELSRHFEDLSHQTLVCLVCYLAILR